MLTVLTGTVASEIEADVLTLTNGANGLGLRAAPEGGITPEGLEGTPWLLDSIVTGSTTTAVASGVRRPTLQLDAGTMTVDTGCNTGSGSYTGAGSRSISTGRGRFGRLKMAHKLGECSQLRFFTTGSRVRPADMTSNRAVARFRFGIRASL